MYSGLGGVNCIYDDGTVIPMDQGPCQEVLDSGAYLVDANTSSSEITVTTPYPVSWGPLLAGLAGLLLIGGSTRARRKR